jgi:hypothetical protein
MAKPAAASQDVTWEALTEKLRAKLAKAGAGAKQHASLTITIQAK